MKGKSAASANGAARRPSRAELEAILGGVADSVTAQAPDGSIVYANEAAARLLGFDSPDDLIAAPPGGIVARYEVLDEDLAPFDLADLPGRRALLGEEAPPVIARFRALPDGEPRWWRVRARPLLGADGTVALAINTTEDITDLKEGEAAARYLAEAGRVLASSLDYEETLRAIARLAVPRIADWCAVDLATEAGAHHVATSHVDPAKLALADDLRRRFPTNPAAPTGVPNVLRTGRPELYPVITDDLLVASLPDPEQLALMRSVGMVSAMMVPMALRDRVLGAVTFVSAESGRHFGSRDLELAEELALRAATAVENARLYRTRSEIARTLQASLLPPVLPEVEGLELAALYRAAGEGYEVGGDFYDVFSTVEDQWFVVMGDVCGKGPEAAAVTALARYTIRAGAARRRSPAAILRWLNEVMLGQVETNGRFATIACAHLDLTRAPARITLACGGHPPPLLLRADGGVEELGVPGMLLGLVEGAEVSDRSTDLRAGDTLVLFTDGLTEAGAPVRLWSPEDLEDALRGAAGLDPAGVIDHLVAAALPAPPAQVRDDVALLALRAR